MNARIDAAVCICVTTFYENVLVLRCFLSLSLSELAPVTSNNLSPLIFLLPSVYFLRTSSFMHCEHFGMGIEAIGMNGTKQVFSHFPQFP